MAQCLNKHRDNFTYQNVVTVKIVVVRDIGLDDMYWNGLALDRDRDMALADPIVNFWVPL
jgi:hypothetical protein